MASSASTDPFYLVKDDIQASVSKIAVFLGGYRLLPVLALPSVSIMGMYKNVAYARVKASTICVDSTSLSTVHFLFQH